METPPPNTQARNMLNLPTSNIRTETSGMRSEMESEEMNSRQRELYQKLRQSIKLNGLSA